MALGGIGVKEIAKKLNAYRYWDTKAASEQKAIRVEGTHPALVSKQDFEAVRRMFKARSPKIIHPTALTSDYLLSGLAFCGSCGSRLIGTQAKSGKFFYYGCQRYLKEGRDSCRAGLVSRSRLGDAVVGQLKDHVLTDDNLTALVGLVNDEMNKELQQVELAKILGVSKASVSAYEKSQTRPRKAVLRRLKKAFKLNGEFERFLRCKPLGLSRSLSIQVRLAPCFGRTIGRDSPVQRTCLPGSPRSLVVRPPIPSDAPSGPKAL